MSIRYGTTDVDKTATELKTSREIVQKILDFGVSQRQMLQVIYLLSLELENREHMLSMSDVAKECLGGNLIAQESENGTINDD